MQTVSVIDDNRSQSDSVEQISESVIDNISHALQGLQFGEITITVRNGNVIQIERVARKRQFKSKPNGKVV